MSSRRDPVSSCTFFTPAQKTLMNDFFFVFFGGALTTEFENAHQAGEKAFGGFIVLFFFKELVHNIL